MAMDDLHTEFSREDSDELESDIQLALEGFDGSHIPEVGIESATSGGRALP
jgi:hypothetical protein